jgi:Ca2+-binding EF-hand superfamily protein
METIADMGTTVKEVELRKAVLSYFCQTVTTDNLVVLKQSLHGKDPSKTVRLSYEEFQQGLAEGNMPILAREFSLITKELDPDETGRIQYKVFLDSVYITKMYMKELELYNVLQERDTEGRGGVTIAEMKQILAGFQFPEEALGAAFQAMLKADINQIEPEKFI